MDDLTTDILIHNDESALQDPEDREDDAAEGSSTPGSGGNGDKAEKKRRGFRGLLKKASMQDQLLDKLFQQVIPVDDAPPGQVQDMDVPDDSMPSYSQRPGFNITTMSNNFRRFNARIGVVFKFQARVIRLLSWRRPSHTAALLAVYTLVCLDPYLLTLLPPAFLLFGVLVPGFVARHPAPVSRSSELRDGKLQAHAAADDYYFSPRGPPIAPARTVKPVKELSRDFFRNMRDLQNSMDDFSVAHDAVIDAVVPATNFSDEARSSALFVALALACLSLSIAAHLLPWRLLALAGGWAAVASGHPAVARALQQARAQHVAPQRDRAKGLLQAWVRADITLDEAPEQREVEIFELQRLSPASGEWEAWVFSPSPYDPLSQPRIAGERPAGTRFFEDVLPPRGWEWSGKKWALDLWSREWVEERIITGVEVETEGERWVYDIYSERDGATGVVDAAADGLPPPPPVVDRPGVSWEEGEEGMGRRGEWRRRRWVRMVRRKKITGTA
ncbi:uncharacterized protein E0L32_006231 [Thyridium curvatum]|uniref:TECPR1-like DysF domain-containing protein n=1 Tax=Thyridium curvatum TaxID=1093900 RepID=A0A507B900_9PEZI|nr:uncharacterized protein E0L32_006231 [Thyridium curvatum]TPX13258.1 hypothetical protein E0L32_006231 [Thyridium curvatum]